MSGKVIRVSRVLRELNISLDTLVEFLNSKGHDVEARPTSKISEHLYNKLVKAFSEDKSEKEASEEVSLKKKQEKEAIIEQEEGERILKTTAVKLSGIKTLGKIDLEPSKEKQSDKSEPQKVNLKSSETSEQKSKPSKTQQVSPPEELATNYQKLTGPKVTGQTLDLAQFDKKESTSKVKSSKKKRKRIAKPIDNIVPKTTEYKGSKKSKERFIPKEEISKEDIQKQVKETLEKLQGKGAKSKAAKYRKEKRDLHRQKTEEELEEQDHKILKVTEFVTASELAVMMDVEISQIISSCMSLGVMVTMNQRLDEDTLALVAEEYGYQLETSKTELEAEYEKQLDEEDTGNLVLRPPVVTVMGHVDHGKTSLLDYIRNETVVAGEAGGITQHMGSYSVTLEENKKITFLDTPGHEAFTAMRARGGQIADIAVIVIAADEDRIKPQTEEAISHAKAMSLPMVIAINKIDKEEANPDKIKEQLSGMNILVEDWGGKVQSQEISAKTGQGISELLDKILLEAEMMDLKASEEGLAIGTVIDAQLQKGRGYVSTVIVKKGTLRPADIVLAGSSYGKLRNIFDERGKPMKSAGPSAIANIVGLDESPRAGDKFYVFEDEKEAKQIAAQRKQQIREQALKTQKMMTLDEIGRRIAVGNFKELNILIKGDVDGSVEALTGSLQNLSTEEISINIISKSVGAIASSDINLAAITGSLIIGFNVKPAPTLKQEAEKEKVEIESFTTIYSAIEFVKDLIADMESPVYEDQSLGKAEVRELFKVSRLGTIAGCMVTEGKVQRIAKVRVLRGNETIFSGEVASLKRFKEDVKEVVKGFDCGIQVKDFNDLEEGDILDIYQEVLVKKSKNKTK